ncbi:uncharacterized protein LOC141632400 [Silene latifolia]|uniref:uncharacterized protein LOC141632400 n=1 Tax=Silene latifolia TaxID=37657 RepID=UPI003D77ADA3
MAEFCCCRMLLLLFSPPLLVHSQFIHCEVLHNVSFHCFHITILYASNDAKERDGLWAHLNILKPMVDKWLLLGDFNVIRDVTEKIGGTLSDLADIMDFNFCLYNCELKDLNSNGCEFTWTNKQHIDSRVWTKLDRAMANVHWLKQFPVCSASFLDPGVSDHSPVVVTVFKDQHRCSRKQQQIIGQIKDRHGTDRLGLDNVAAGFVDYYQSLLGESSSVFSLDKVFIQQSPVVSSEDAAKLILPITYEEIRTALFTIGSDKSPGPDGFSSAFFKHSWNLIGDTLCKAVHSFFSTGRMSKQANSTLIALIPKKKGKSGIRQGDPLSPYIFVLSIEILSRYLRCLKSQPLVSLHPKCSKVGLTHLIFVDDLMVFIRGDVPSVQAVSTALTNFSHWYGLHPNVDKTEIYFGGVHPSIKTQILHTSGFSEGYFPFRYLGLPLNIAHTFVDMYGILINKIQASIQHWSSKFLSYAGRLQLLNTVVFGLENFWRMVAKSWSSICSPLAEGGFCVKELLSWNKALISKWLWLIEQPPQGLWSAWHNAYNLSNCSVWDTTTQGRFSESFRSIINVKDDLLAATGSPSAARTLLQSWCFGDKFSVTAAYNWFRPRSPTVPWHKGLSHKALQCAPSSFLE